jgi:hypothetical protein
MSNLEMEITDSGEEEDEEMTFIVFPTLYQLWKKNSTPMNTSVQTGPMYIRELLDSHPTRCYDVLRMESQNMNKLLVIFNYLIVTSICSFLNHRKLELSSQLGT